MFVSKSEREVCVVSPWVMVPCVLAAALMCSNIRWNLAVAADIADCPLLLQTIAERERLFKEAEEEKEREKERRQARAVSCKHMYHP